MGLKTKFHFNKLTASKALGAVLVAIFLLSMAVLPIAKGASDYTLYNYTIHDPNDQFTGVTTNLYNGVQEIQYLMSSSWTYWADPCWIYEDLGVATSDFTYTLRFNVTDVVSSGGAVALLWGMSNSGGVNWANLRPDTIDVYLIPYSGHFNIWLYTPSGSTHYDNLQLDTNYALKIEKAGSQLSVSIYEWAEGFRQTITEEDEPFTTLFGVDQESYRYVYYAHGEYTGGAGFVDVYVEYLNPIYPGQTPEPSSLPEDLGSPYFITTVFLVTVGGASGVWLYRSATKSKVKKVES